MWVGFVFQTIAFIAFSSFQLVLASMRGCKGVQTYVHGCVCVSGLCLCKWVCVQVGRCVFMCMTMCLRAGVFRECAQPLISSMFMLVCVCISLCVCVGLCVYLCVCV